jgi:hypothetical protein
VICLILVVNRDTLYMLIIFKVAGYSCHAMKQISLCHVCCFCPSCGRLMSSVSGNLFSDGAELADCSTPSPWSLGQVVVRLLLDQWPWVLCVDAFISSCSQRDGRNNVHSWVPHSANCFAMNSHVLDCLFHEVQISSQATLLNLSLFSTPSDPY